MNTSKNLDTVLPSARKAGFAASPAAGFTLMELLMVVAIGVIVTAIAMPRIDTTMRTMHLGSAASSLASAIQKVRFQAISTGCNVQMAISAQTYVVTDQTLSGTPPTCSAAYTADPVLVGAIPFTAANGDVTLTPTTTVTMQFYSDGTVRAVGGTAPANFSLVLGLTQSKGTATKTISVSGLGYVKVQ